MGSSERVGRLASGKLFAVEQLEYTVDWGTVMEVGTTKNIAKERVCQKV